ncbi:MAG TPA: pyridoxal phosphate-dependent aminotransferase [Bryobacteraceae bacterium]|nr:pyridoxal phosphate-dependent aminotransferase [Bryobacteraceae bacterium]
MDRIATLQPTAVNAILAEVRALQAEGRSLVSLMRGEPDFRTPAHIAEACTRALQNGRTGYPDNRGEKVLRDAVAVKLKRDNGLEYDPATEIIATAGATFGIYAALAALLEEGDEVLLQDPVYDAYQSPVKLVGGVARPVRAEIVDGRFVMSAEALEAAWTPRVKALILNAPWNPVGTVLTPAELRVITEFCLRRNVWLIGDEIYEAITYGGAKHLSALAAAPELRERYIHVNSLSKTYSMPGWRVGYCAGPKAMIQRMFMVLAQSSRGPATFIQDAAAEALAGSQACVDEMRTEYTRRRGLVLAALDGIKGVRGMPPEGGFFAMADIRALGQPSNDVRKRLLHEHGLVVVHGAAYGPGGEGTLRISFASGGEILARGLDALRKGLS